MTQTFISNRVFMEEKVVVERFDIIKYEDLYSEMLSVIQDKDDINDFKDTFDHSPSNIFLSFYNGLFSGMAWFTPPSDNETVIGIWVKKRFRKKGCGKALLRSIDSALLHLNTGGNLTAFCFSDGGKKTSSLVVESGFEYSHSYVTMRYNNVSINIDNSAVDLVNYSDEYYEQTVELRNSGIKEAGAYYGENASDLFFKDDLEYRKYMNSVSKNAFMIVNNGIVDGFVMVRGSEIMALNVRKTKRGEGYAKILVKKCIEYLRSMRVYDIELICVDKNVPAYNLYRNLGFRAVGAVRCYKKIF